jgi:hypothetical protein
LWLSLEKDLKIIKHSPLTIFPILDDLPSPVRTRGGRFRGNEASSAPPSTFTPPCLLPASKKKGGRRRAPSPAPSTEKEIGGGKRKRKVETRDRRR